MARGKGKGSYREGLKARHMHHTHSARGMSKRPHMRRKGGRY